MSVLPVERPGPMYSPFHSDLDDPDHLTTCAGEVRLVAQPAAVARARAFTRARLARWGLGEMSDACVLVVSEMTTNAITVTRLTQAAHGHVRALPPGARSFPEGGDVPDRPPSPLPPGSLPPAAGVGAYSILLRLRLTATDLFAEVWDDCGGTPEPADAGEDDESGRGLYLVGMCSDEWGHLPAPGGGKVVFARWGLPAGWSGSASPPRWPYAHSHARTTRA
ncbi:ATP-binding protein [Streptosporangium sp. NPDC050855]|uniref:ATP-binding protein n=1 Tax=Streptosporangium sp. NPDC050855 TaxID=3366194 RepID=UPI00379DF7E9